MAARAAANRAATQALALAGLTRALPMRAQRQRHAASSQLALQHERLDGRARRQHALDPHAVLARGYAWVEGADGRPVVSVQALKRGDRVTGVWSDGRAELDVGAVDLGDVEAAGTPARD